MQVSAAIKQRVTDILKAGIAKAEARYKVSIPYPKVVYEQGGSTAGTANYRTWTIDLNPGLLMKNTEEFLSDTVLHELGHLVCDKVYPEAHVATGGSTTYFSRARGRFIRRRAPREVHGPRWHEVTRACGHPDPSRCHDMDTTGVSFRKAGGGDWMCTCGCNKKTHVGPKIHAQLLANPFARWYHKGYALQQVGAVVQPKSQGVTIIKTGFEGPGVTTVQKVGGFKDVTVVKSQDQVGSKIEQCWAIYKRNVGSSRAAIIQTMVSIANCTPAGAATYYATCKKRYESGVL